MNINTFPSNKRLKELAKSEDGKLLLSNFLALSVLQVAGFIFPLITMPYLAHTIGVDGFGRIAFGASVIAYLQTIVDWGFKYTAVRDIAKNKDNIDYISRIFLNVMGARIILMFFSGVILEILILSIPLFYDNQLVLWATFCMIPGYILFPDWLFQAMERMKYITIMNFLSKLFFVSLIFFVITKEEDYIFEPILTAFGYLLSGIISIYYAIKIFKLKLYWPHLHEIKETMKDGWDVFLTQFIPTLYNNLSVILLSAFWGKTATGLFNSGYKFINLSEQFTNVLSRTFFPFLARRGEKHSVYVKITCVFSVVTCVVLFLSSDFLIDIFFTPEFQESSKVLKLLSITPFFLFLLNTYGTNGLILIGGEIILRKIITYCSLFGTVFAIISVYYLSYMGVALTLVVVWGIRGLLTYIFYKKQIVVK